MLSFNSETVQIHGETGGANPRSRRGIVKKGFIIALAVGLLTLIGVPQFSMGHLAPAGAFSLISLGTEAYASPPSRTAVGSGDVARQMYQAWLEPDFAGLETLAQAVEAIGAGNCPGGIALLVQLPVKRMAGMVIPGTTILWTDALIEYSARRFGVRGNIDQVVTTFIGSRGLDRPLCSRFTRIYQRAKAHVDRHNSLTYGDLYNMLEEELIGWRAEFVSGMRPALEAVAAELTPRDRKEPRGRGVKLDIESCTTVSDPDSGFSIKACGSNRSGTMWIILLALALIASALGL